ncbi:unnamed protein product [Boreogadus saida]
MLPSSKYLCKASMFRIETTLACVCSPTIVEALPRSLIYYNPQEKEPQPNSKEPGSPEKKNESELKRLAVSHMPMTASMMANAAQSKDKEGHFKGTREPINARLPSTALPSICNVERR